MHSRTGAQEMASPILSEYPHLTWHSDNHSLEACLIVAVTLTILTTTGSYKTIFWFQFSGVYYWGENTRRTAISFPNLGNWLEFEKEVSVWISYLPSLLGPICPLGILGADLCGKGQPSHPRPQLLCLHSVLWLQSCCWNFFSVVTPVLVQDKCLSSGISQLPDAWFASAPHQT